jgi:hypothetical protein
MVLAGKYIRSGGLLDAFAPEHVLGKEPPIVGLWPLGYPASHMIEIALEAVSDVQPRNIRRGGDSPHERWTATVLQRLRVMTSDLLQEVYLESDRDLVIGFYAPAILMEVVRRYPGPPCGNRL